MVFSLKSDFIYFLLLPIIFVLTFYFFQFDDKNLQIAMVYIRVLVDSPHFFLTFIPLTNRVNDSGFKYQTSLFLMVGCLAFISTLCFISIVWMINFMFFMSVYHTIKQQIGWMNISDRKVNKQSKFLVWATYIFMFGSFFHFLFSPGTHFDFNFLKEFKSLTLANNILIGTLSLFIIFLSLSIYKKENILKNFSFWGSIVWFLFACIIFKNEILFYMSIITLHPIPYIGICFKEYKQRNGFEIKKLILNIVIYMLISVVFTYILIQGYLHFKALFLVFAFSIILSHYTLDAYVWKRKYGFKPQAV